MPKTTSNLPSQAADSSLKKENTSSNPEFSAIPEASEEMSYLPPASSLNPALLLKLQRIIGNRAVQRYIAGSQPHFAKGRHVCGIGCGHIKKLDSSVKTDLETSETNLARHQEDLPAISRLIQRTVTLDYPAPTEVVKAGNYSIRLGVQGTARNVKVQIDANPPQPARFDATSGYWWFDWSPVGPREYTLTATSDDESGVTTSTGPQRRVVARNDQLSLASGDAFKFLVVPDTWVGPRQKNCLTETEFTDMQAAWNTLKGASGGGLGNTGGLQLKDARTDIQQGQAGTAAGQAEALLKQLGKEFERSEVYRQTLVPLILNQRHNPDGTVTLVKAFLAKDSVAFVDSAATLGMDIADLDNFPDNPVEASTVGQPGAPGKKIGLTRGEMLMHVIEERIYMAGGDTYEIAHEKCLSPNSAQNRYRRERGITNDSIKFHCQPHYHDTGTPQAQELSDFIATDSEGYVTYVKNIMGNRTMTPGSGYTPSQAQTSSGFTDVNKAIGKNFYEALDLTKSKLTKNETPDDLHAILPALHHWIEAKAARDNPANPAGETAIQKDRYTMELLRHKIRLFLEGKNKNTMVETVPQFKAQQTGINPIDVAKAHIVTQIITAWANRLNATVPQAQQAKQDVENERATANTAKNNDATTQADLAPLGGLAANLNTERGILDGMKTRNTNLNALRQQYAEEVANSGPNSPETLNLLMQLSTEISQHTVDIQTWHSQPRLLTYEHAQSHQIRNSPWVRDKRLVYKYELTEIERYKADQLLAQAALNASSQELSQKRAGKKIMEFINDATGGTEKYNCSLVTIAAINGLKSGDMTLRWQNQKGAVRKDRDLQTDSTWFLAENDKLGNRDKSWNPEHALHDMVGDAQWNGMQTYLKALPQVKKGTHEVVVFGKPEFEEMVDEQALIT
jgi:hypothetical protein